MIDKPMDVLQQFPVRKSKKQKTAFRDAVSAYARKLGYSVKEEKGSYGCRNLILGDPETARYLVTAHYDTPASIGLPNLLTPCNLFFYVLWQLLIVGILFFLAFLVGFVVMLLTRNELLVFWAAYLSYFGILFLMLLGPGNQNNANDNTSGVVTVLEIAASIPQIHRDKVCIVLFDLEEAGLIGSASYRKAHKAETQKQIVLNLDCVGDGDHILFFPTKKLKKDRKKLNPMYTCCGQFGNKFITIRDKGVSIYPSDQKNFPYGVGIAAFRKGKLGLYLNRIHTKKDTILEQTNVNILRSAIVTYITCTK